MRILLIAGGWSSEREVSLSGAKGIAKAIIELGHELVEFDPSLSFDGLSDIASHVDFAFINMHGSPGEDGLIQAMLERLGCPFQGAGPAGSFLALNKAASKQLYRSHGLTTPDWEYHPTPPQGFGRTWKPALGLPVFVKPNNGGSSVDMGQAEDMDALCRLMGTIFDKSGEVLMERSIQGTELTCAVLGDEPLPPILIKPEGGATFFDYSSKYTPGGATETCPAPVSPELTEELMATAMAAHQILGLRGCSRSDFLHDGSTLYLIETNTLPGMTPTSLLPQAAAAAGYSFNQLIARLIELGIERDNHTT